METIRPSGSSPSRVAVPVSLPRTCSSSGDVTRSYSRSALSFARDLGASCVFALVLFCALSSSLSSDRLSPSSLPRASFAAGVGAPPTGEQFRDIKRVLLRLEAHDGRVYDLDVGGLHAVAGGQPMGAAPGHLAPGAAGHQRELPAGAPEQKPSTWRKISHHAANTVVASVLFLAIGEAYNWLKRRRQQQRMQQVREELEREKEMLALQLKSVEQRLEGLEQLEAEEERGEPGKRMTGKQKAELSMLRKEREELVIQQQRNELRDGQLNGFPVAKKATFSGVAGFGNKAKKSRGNKNGSRKRDNRSGDEDVTEESDPDFRPPRDGRGNEDSSPDALDSVTSPRGANEEAQSSLLRRGEHVDTPERWGTGVQSTAASAKRGQTPEQGRAAGIGSKETETASTPLATGSGNVSAEESAKDMNAGEAAEAKAIGRRNEGEKGPVAGETVETGFRDKRRGNEGKKATHERVAGREPSEKKIQVAEDEDDEGLMQGEASLGAKKLRYISQLLQEHPGLSPEEAIDMVHFMSKGHPHENHAKRNRGTTGGP
ncbi:conserved hypothetical protein [Neospora caninum Liverpool]|uniref:Uncharacterized protein n=1 Tax=Neospora caninum (strain Liverpool) TaxID=572307 RepID=F0V9D6_NEOCL|nr:conserved hypothetical protein [Neospora caninum Liverpool]CBZ50361.1 conserved hypothetical protein [Neospora caninum Liverpool]CEL64967.1 TPA: hypothetical protein BN1204_008310 [Neospora caninum Liverpool]|eukprot:XP_003880395.1 conserved hypothetical protein [Neospora caninum Liverpool]